MISDVRILYCMSPLRVLKHIKIVRGVNIIHQLKRYNNHNMQNNEHPSIERIFNLVEMQRHAVGVSFMPDTKSMRNTKLGLLFCMFYLWI